LWIDEKGFWAIMGTSYDFMRFLLFPNTLSQVIKSTIVENKTFLLYCDSLGTFVHGVHNFILDFIHCDYKPGILLFGKAHLSWHLQGQHEPFP